MKQLPGKLRGVALVSVLWIVALLTVVATGLVASVRYENRAVANLNLALQAQYAVESGVELAALNLMYPRSIRWPVDGSVREVNIATRSPLMTGAGSLQDRHALVTGGGTGIGLGIARRLLEHGAIVTLAARREKVLAEAADDLRASAPDAQVRIVRCDITVEGDVAAAVAAASDERGRLDIAVANSGSGGLSPLLDADPDDWRAVLDLNVVGTMLTIKHAALAMRDSGGGSIVAISSTAGEQTMPFLAPYSASKAGLEMLVRCAADELGGFGIRVNAIRPGLVLTDVMAAAYRDPEMRRNLEASTPLRTVGRGEEIGDAVVYLSTGGGSWVTGQVWAADGGMTIHRGPSLERLARQAFGDEAIDRVKGPAARD